jgi:hypothetical protein
MDSMFKLPFAKCSDDPVVQEGIERCPFLRNINEPTVFSFSSASFPTPVSHFTFKSLSSVDWITLPYMIYLVVWVLLDVQI